MKLYEVRVTFDVFINLFTPGKTKPFVVTQGLPENVKLHSVVAEDNNEVIVFTFVDNDVVTEDITVIAEQVTNEDEEHVKHD